MKNINGLVNCIVNFLLFIELKTLLNVPGIVILLVLVPMLILIDRASVKNINKHIVTISLKLILITVIKYLKPTLIVYSEENIKWSTIWLYHILLVTGNEYNIEIKTKIDNVKDTENILPLGVKANTILYKNEYSNILDDKRLFYDFVKHHINTNIQLIPTYDKNYTGKNIHGTFILKLINGAGGSNEIVKDNIYNLIQNYADTHIIQDVIDIKEMYTYVAFCESGSVKSYMGYKTDNLKWYQFMTGSNRLFVKNLSNEITDCCEKIIKKTNYSGYINIQFIKDLNNTYIMECNPRLCGCCRIPLYFKNIVEKNTNLKSSHVSRLLKWKKHKYNNYGLHYNLLIEILEFLLL